MTSAKIMSDHRITNSKGPLVLIGGAEDKQGDREVLREVGRRLNGGKLVIATVASKGPRGYFQTCQRAFEGPGIADLVELYIGDRFETLDPDKLRPLDGAAAVFFSGSDQLRIASQIGGTPVEHRLRNLHDGGA
jgi:cyanophycinase